MIESNLTTFGKSKILIIDGDRGANYPNKSELSSSGHCVFLSTGNVTKNGFDFGSIDFIDEEKDSALRKGKVQIGDIVLTTRGTVGNVALISETIPYQNIRINSGMVIIRVDPDKYVPYFFWIFLRSNLFKKQCLSHGSGSAQPQLPIAALKNISFPNLCISNQIDIAEIIRVLDNKIELNNRINTELEAMAKTLYDYWFVQFDFPDANGKPYKTSGGKMVYNAALKREIPEGWADIKIGKMESNIVTGKTPSTANSDYFNGEIPFITIGDIRGSAFIVKTEQTLSIEGANSQGNKYLPKGAICVTCIASPGLVGFVTQTSQTNQQINSVICSNEFNRYFLYFAINGYFSGAKAKTGNTFANMNKGDFSEILVVEPLEDIRKFFHEKIDAVFKEIKIKSQENIRLEQLRDYLLPMLMNGQVTVVNKDDI